MTSALIVLPVPEGPEKRTLRLREAACRVSKPHSPKTRWRCLTRATSSLSTAMTSSGSTRSSHEKRGVTSRPRLPRVTVESARAASMRCSRGLAAVAEDDGTADCAADATAVEAVGRGQEVSLRVTQRQAGQARLLAPDVGALRRAGRG